MDPLVSVVIVNFNGQQFLGPCLSALAGQTCTDFEIILVDNNSSDGSVRYVRERFPRVRIIGLKENTGFTGGANAGIRASRGRYILTLNNDTFADPGFIGNLIRPMDADPGVGMCASRMLFPDGRINSTGICISRSGAAWDRGIYEDDTGQYDAEGEVFGPCAGAALYRKSMLDEIGLFDEDFFIFMEDVDLAFRGRLAGWKCAYVPSARVMHHMGGTAGRETDISVFYGNRNLIWNTIKNFPTRTLLECLPWILGRNIGDIPYYLMRGKGCAILKAKASALSRLPEMVNKRKNSVNRVTETQIRKWIQVWMTPI